MRKLLLEHRRAPGDVLVMTALVRDLALTYPGQYAVGVHTNIPELWQHNPYVTDLANDRRDIQHVVLNYRYALDNCYSRNRHFLMAFHEDLANQTGIRVPLLYPRPDYHLSDEERQVPYVSGRYWVVIAGGKTDFLTKHWSYKRYQQVVNLLRGFDLRFVQVGAYGANKDKNLAHVHPRLENTLCMVGATTLRDMARLIAHADGVIGPVTAGMHLAAALQKPCVVINGGREEWWWEGYAPGLGNFGNALREDVSVPHHFLHTMNQLACCSGKGCWAQGFTGPRACVSQVDCGGQTLPKCMDMITVEHVVEAVMRYYEDGTIPPIDKPREIVFFDGKPRFKDQISPGCEDYMPSALAEALKSPEPQLLIKTDGQRTVASV